MGEGGGVSGEPREWTKRHRAAVTHRFAATQSSPPRRCRRFVSVRTCCSTCTSCVSARVFNIGHGLETIIPPPTVIGSCRRRRSRKNHPPRPLSTIFVFGSVIRDAFRECPRRVQRLLQLSSKASLTSRWQMASTMSSFAARVLRSASFQGCCPSRERRFDIY